MKRYNISEVSKMFGISSEALRHYERRGLIAPLRSENGYRTYTKPDIYILSSIRLLRNMGYSLIDVERMYKADFDGAVEIWQKRLRELKTEISYQQLKLAAVEEEYKAFCELRHLSGEVEWATSPAMLRVNNQINDDFLIDDIHIQKWVEHMPIVRISPSFSKDAVTGGTDEIRFGYAVPLEFARNTGLIHTPAAEIKHPGRCLTTVIHSRGRQYLSARMLAPMVRFCTENHLQITGEAWGITLGAYTKENEQLRFHRMYIPVREIY